jgi:hypothetical protein
MGQETNHVREVITLLHPESKATLQPGMVYPMAGTLGDGEPERIELMFKVEGYTDQEIQAEDLLISFLLDGEPTVAYRAFLPPGDHIEVETEGEFTRYVQFEEIEIPDQQPATALTFRAELQLPGGDPSVHEVAPVMTSQRDVRAIFGHPPLVGGQSYVISLDRDTQIARADVSAEGQQFSIFYDQSLDRSYYPNPQAGGYWYADGALGGALVAPLTPVEWPPRRLEEGGFAYETYPCGEERCDRYRARQEGGEMVLSYDESGLLIELEISSPDGGGTIRYEYGPISLAAPANASPAPVPIPFVAPSLPIPDVP